MATVTRTPKRPQDGTAADLTASVTLAPTGPVAEQAEELVSRPSRGRFSRLWHRVRMAIQEMNYAVRRLTEIQAFPEQSYRQAQPSRPSRPSAH